MRDNKSTGNTPKNTSARTPAAGQSAVKPISLAERREKSTVRLPYKRHHGTKYQVIRRQYLRQAEKKENVGNKSAASLKKTAVGEGKQSDFKQQILSQNFFDSNDTVSSEKKSSIVIPESERSADTEYAEKEHTAKEKYAKSQKAAEYTEKLQRNIELSRSPLVSSNNETNNYKQSKQSDNSEKEQTAEKQIDVKYKERAEAYLNKLKENSETVGHNCDKDIGDLYKKAYKLEHRDEIIGIKDKKKSPLFDKAKTAIQIKSEIDNAVSKNNVGDSAALMAAIPMARASEKAVQALSDKSRVFNAGRTVVELAAKTSDEAASSDSTGEAVVNAVLAVPKYAVERKVEKTVHQVMQNQYNRNTEIQREKLREKMERVEKRAQQMKKEEMQRNMKVNLYKSEHGMGSSGSTFQRAKSAVKTALNGMKNAVRSLKSMKVALVAGGGVFPIILLILVVIILILFVIFPFLYITPDGTEENMVESEFIDTVNHYHSVMDEVVREINGEIDAIFSGGEEYGNTGVINPVKKAQYDADYKYWSENVLWNPSLTEPKKDYWYSEAELCEMGRERGPIFEGFRWSPGTDARKVPYGKLYDEMLCTIAAYNAKIMSQSGNNDIILMNDESVKAAYAGANFWELNEWRAGVGCPQSGECCSKKVPVTVYDEKGNAVGVKFETQKYCPGHFVIMVELKLNFDLDEVWEDYEFTDKDKENYREIKKNFDAEKRRAH